MIFFEHRITDTEGKIIEFEALDDSVSIGRCLLTLNDDNAEITEICFKKNNGFIVDGLLKAAFNYAANRNYYMGICSAANVDEYLLKMNFSKTDNGYVNDIPSILMGSCKNCKK